VHGDCLVLVHGLRAVSVNRNRLVVVDRLGAVVLDRRFFVVVDGLGAIVADVQRLVMAGVLILVVLGFDGQVFLRVLVDFLGALFVFEAVFIRSVAAEAGVRFNRALVFSPSSP